VVHVETVVSPDVSDTKFVSPFNDLYKYQEEFNIKGFLFRGEHLAGIYTPDYQLIPVNVELPWNVRKALFKAKIKVKGVIEVIYKYDKFKVTIYLMDLKSKRK